MTAARIVLVGEADAPAVADCRSCLRDHGFDTFAGPPEGGARIARHVSPDVVIVDVPSGCDDARRLKADAATAHIPVVAMGEATTEQIEMGANAHCNAFVCKPCIAEHLVACVRALISDARIIWAARAESQPPT
jgi:DNA-binding response OmpR family regulator